MRVHVIPGDLAIYTAVVLTPNERVVLKRAMPISIEGDIDVVEARASTIRQPRGSTYAGLSCARRWPPTKHHYTLPVSGFVADPDKPPNDAVAISFWVRGESPVSTIKGVRVLYTDESGELRYQTFHGTDLELNIGRRGEGDDLPACRPAFDDGSTF